MAVLKGYIKADNIQKELGYSSARPEAKALLLQVIDAIKDTINANIKSVLIAPAEANIINLGGGENIDADINFTLGIEMRGMDAKDIMKQMTPQLKKVLKAIKTIKVKSDEFVTHISNFEILNPQTDYQTLYPGIGLRIQIYS